MASSLLPKLGAGGIRARSGGTAPPAFPGYTVKGLGRGNWEYLPGGSKAPVRYTTPAAATPFLTGPQQAGQIKYDTTYGYNVAALNRKLGDATATTNQNLANSQRTHDLGYNTTNQNTAARGLFQSSIRGTDLNDLDTAMTMRNNILNTNLARMNIDTQSQLAKLGTDYATTHNLYNTMAVSNAQGIPPVVPTALPAAQPTAWTPPKQPAAPKAPGSGSPNSGYAGIASNMGEGSGPGAGLEAANDAIAGGKGLG